MSKVFHGLLCVGLCFCLICSICGVGFAAEGGEVPVEPPPDVAEPPAEVPDVPPPDVVAPPDEVPETPPPDVPDEVPETPPPDDEALSTPPPDDDSTASEPPDDGGEDVTPAPVPDDAGGDLEPSGGSSLAPPPDIDVTYVALPEDYVIKSSSLEGMYAIDPQSALAPVTPSNTSGLKSVLLSILGNYDPIVAEYQYVGSGSYNNYIREIQPDYVWLTSAAIFAILLYSTWRLLGGLICKM